MLKSYIDNNNTWYNYFSSFIPKITIEKNTNTQQEDTKTNVIDAIAGLFAPYIGIYEEFDQDAEFIANFVGIIAGGHYSGKVIEIVQPMANYFEQTIHEEFLQYQSNKDTSSFCLPLPEHSSIFADTY